MGKIFGKTFFAGQTSSVFKKANLASMSKATTKSDRDISTKIVAATFENETESEEVSAEKVWRKYGYFDARRSNYSMEKVNFKRILFPNVLSTLILAILTF